MKIRVVLTAVTVAAGLHVLLGLGLSHLSKGEPVRLLPPAPAATAKPVAAATAPTPPPTVAPAATAPAKISPTAQSRKVAKHRRRAHVETPPATAETPSRPPVFDLAPNATTDSDHQ